MEKAWTLMKDNNLFNLWVEDANQSRYLSEQVDLADLIKFKNWPNGLIFTIYSKDRPHSV